MATMAQPTRPALRSHRAVATVVTIIVALFVFSAAVFATLVYRSYRELQAAHNVSTLSATDAFTAAGTSTVPGLSIVDRRVVETTDDPSLGPADAKVTIVEFGDFQCPFSQRSVATMKQLLEKFGNKIRFIFRDFPNSSIHDNAQSAAMAAQCAHEQGKYWQYYDLLFLNADNLLQADLLRYAGQLRLDTAAFQTCLASERHKGEVDADALDGTNLGVSGTPTWFINGHRVEGAIPYATFEKIVKYGLKGKL